MVQGKTRALWVELETIARQELNERISRKAILNQSTRFWDRLTADHKKRFLDAYRNYSNTTIEAAEEAAETGRGQRGADQINIDAQTDWQNYIAKYEQAAEAWRGCMKLQERKLDAVHNLVDVVSDMVEGVDAGRNELLAHPAVQFFLLDEVNNARELLRNFEDRVKAAQSNADDPPIPFQRPDGRKKIALGWASSNSEKRRRRRRKKKFKRGHPGGDINEQRWMGAWMMPEGGMGMAGLWMKLDQNDHVEDRVVRKDTYPSPSNWWLSQTWWGNVKDPSERKPYEIETHMRLDGLESDLDDGQKALDINVPKLRSSFVDDDELMYSVALEYCPLDSLEDVIHRYREKNDRIPEPFIWRTFHSLAEVGLAMEQGHAHPLRAPKPGHHEIVHRDIKPSNVFLAAPTPEYFVDYPTPKLGDFGLSFITTADDPVNPDMYVDGGGTEGFCAPEQMAYVSTKNLEKLDRFKMLAHTNVWATGLVIFAMAQLQEYPRQPRFVGNGEEVGDAHDIMGNRIYSEELKSLIRDCIRFHPDDRPTWIEVLGRIEEALNENGLDRGQEMRFEKLFERGYDPRRLEYLLTQKYAIGMARDELPGIEEGA